jgi:hypothetical protein
MSNSNLLLRVGMLVMLFALEPALAVAEAIPRLDTPISIIYTEDQEFQELKQKFEKCTGKSIRPRPLKSGDPIVLLRRKNVVLECFWITRAEACLIGLLDAADCADDSKLGDPVLWCKPARQ